MAEQPSESIPATIRKIRASMQPHIDPSELLPLERTILRKSRGIPAPFKQQSLASERAVRHAVRSPSRAINPEEAQASAARRKDYLLGLLDTRIQQAQESAKSRISKLPKARQEQETERILRSEFLAVLRAARRQERQLWDAIPADADPPEDMTSSLGLLFGDARAFSSGIDERLNHVAATGLRLERPKDGQ